MSGHRKAAHAIDRHIDRRIQRYAGRLQVAVVKQLTPLVLDPIGLSYNLHASDIIFTQSVEKYHDRYGLQRGDNVIVERISGSWYIMDVISDTPQPDSSGDKYYPHDQPSAATVWNIHHNLGKNPAITCFDSTGRLIVGRVDHMDANYSIVTFNHAQSGRADCN